MATFTVHEPPNPPADRIDRAASLLFVKDGFSLTAAIFAPLWLLAHRLWWPLVGYILLCAVLEPIRWVLDADPGWVGLGIFGLHLLIGMEADTLRRWRLDRGGWRVVGSVSGRNATECERRFYDGWLPAQPVIAPAAGLPPRPMLPSGKTPVIGTLQGIRS